jgi:CheY-like chemotaxis protein
VAVPPVQRDPAAQSTPEELRSAWLGDPETLLLVEDDAGDAVLVEELLADSGVRATLSWAPSLAEANRMLRRDGVPGCILLDLRLPDAQGLAAVAAGAQDYLIKGQSAPDVFSRAIRYARSSQARRAGAGRRPVAAGDPHRLGERLRRLGPFSAHVDLWGCAVRRVDRGSWGRQPAGL